MQFSTTLFADSDESNMFALLGRSTLSIRVWQAGFIGMCNNVCGIKVDTVILPIVLILARQTLMLGVACLSLGLQVCCMRLCSCTSQRCFIPNYALMLVTLALMGVLTGEGRGGGGLKQAGRVDGHV